jgi:hypothetical protein
MASALATIRGLGVRNTRTISQIVNVGMTRAGTTARGSFIRSGAMREFMQTGLNRRIVGRTTSSAVRAQTQQKLGNKFFSARENETPATILQQIRSRFFHTTRARRTTPPNPNPTPHLNSPKNENLSLGQRMRKLSREYGWAALGVYLALTALDFPFCYLFVRWLGTDKIGNALCFSMY